MCGNIFKIRFIFFIMNLVDNYMCDDCAYGTSLNMHYNGTLARTIYGNPCVRWDTLHDQLYLLDSHFPNDDSIDAANNYCRDPYFERDEVHCYALNPEPERQLCSIPFCSDDTAEHVTTVDGELMRCTLVPESGRCAEDEVYYCRETDRSVWTRKQRIDCEQLFCCVPRGCWDGPAHEYNGTWRHGDDGTPCKAWNTLTREDPDPLNFPELSLDAAEDFCRDPDLLGYPYCVTNKRGFRGRFIKLPCEIPSCDDYYSRHRLKHDCYTITDTDRQMFPDTSDEGICEAVAGRFYIDQPDADGVYPGCVGCSCCQKKGCYSDEIQNYSGTWSKTKSGWPCKLWTDTDFKDDAWRFVDTTVADAHNYCRHTKNQTEGRLWCVTDNPHKVYEECDIPHCTDVTSSVATSTLTTPTETSTTVKSTTTTMDTKLTTKLLNDTGPDVGTTHEDELIKSRTDSPENTAVKTKLSWFSKIVILMICALILF